jgi:hypothetical protein
MSPSIRSFLLACGVAATLASTACQSNTKAESKAAAGTSSTAVATPKIAVKTADDLPRHTYSISGKASEFLTTDKPFKDFVAQVKGHTEETLAKYYIQDPTTLSGYYALLQQIAMFEGNTTAAVDYANRVKALETKESKKLMSGQVIRAYAAAKGAGAPGSAAFDAEFKNTLKKNVAALPIEKVREELTSARGRAQIVNKELLMGSIAGQLDPVVEQQKGVLSSDLATGLIGARVTLDTMLPLMPKMAEVYGDILTANPTQRADTWTPTLVTLPPTAPAKPVTIAVWDSGVDIAIFEKTGQAWTNKGEIINGKDDDKNGFIDDVHGIAYDLKGDKVPEILHSITELKSPLPLMEANMKGLGDVQSGIESKEADAFRSYIKTLKRDQITPFLEDLGLYGNYSHGTHVAGIASEGNPFARILAARITFDYKEIPQIPPSEELSRKVAQAAIDTVNYFKAAEVRVVNMSWGGSRKDIETTLEKCGIGKSSEERAEISRKLFNIEKEGLERAMRSAPDILFICAAGNSDNDNDFAELIPSGLKLPNMLTVGAIDSAAKPTSFTTFGKGVRLYANGFEVDSYVPGGKRMKFNGTSMASPNAANLAAKLFALKPSLTVPQAIELMNKGADPMVGYEGRFVINPKKTIGLLDAGK